MKKLLFLSAILMLTLNACHTDGLGISGDPALSESFNVNGLDGDKGSYDFTLAGEQYNDIIENGFIPVQFEPVSTFSIDADGASYSNIRRILSSSTLPPNGAIRIEEMINYFPLNYQSDQVDPITLNGEIATCPWNESNKLVRIGMQGIDIPRDQLPPSNIVFLIDVSGSMNSEDKLELLKDGLLLFAEELTSEDRISIVTYASNPGVLLESTPGDKTSKIKQAIRGLTSGGSTNGAGGITTAYEIAEANYIQGGNNRIIMGTDGDFNVGISSQDDLINLIEEKRESGVFLTVIGLGSGNYQEGAMEQLANHGNGTFEYIDNLDQAKKVFIHEYQKFYAAAKDVKVQIAFDPRNVIAYRLIGYENRLLNEEDFNDDTKDAGEISIGQNITAFYEIIPKEIQDRDVPAISVDFRYKLPEGSSSELKTLGIYNDETSFKNASENLRFAAGVAGFGMMLLDSEHKGDTDYDKVLSWIDEARSYDPQGHRKELLELIEIAKNL